MGQILTIICDNCKLPIKDKEKKYYFLLQEIVDFSGIQDISDIINRYNTSFNSTKLKVICPKCKKIFDYLFSIRKEKMKKILKEIELSYKPLIVPFKFSLLPYCKCKEFQDRGIIVDGISDGICYVCGGKQKPLSAKELIIEEEENDNETV